MKASCCDSLERKGRVYWFIRRVIQFIRYLPCRFKKSNMQSWAEREVEIACNYENPDRKKGEFDYGCCCYESALKAFKSLCEDGHSGFSIKMTQHILNRLLDGKPLTPIEDTPDVWNDCIVKQDDYICYQNSRMSSLFKYVYSDGRIRYSNVDQYYCIDINNPDSAYTTGLVSRIIEELFPITMPYYPGGPIKVYCEDFLTDLKNGDYDTKGVFYAIKPDGERVEINRFFKEPETSGKGNFFAQWDEITKEEYEARKASKIERR